MNAILKYPGGKWGLANWIINFFPEHHSYLEPFLAPEQSYLISPGVI